MFFGNIWKRIDLHCNFIFLNFRKIIFFLDWIKIKFKLEILTNNVMNANKAINLLMDLVFFQITVH